MKYLILSIITLSTSQVLADFRCGTHVIKEGDHYLEVQRACGEPDVEEEWIEDGIVSREIHPSLRLRERVVEGVVVRMWTYNFGPQKFMRQLKFRNGLLVSIEKVGYGF